MAAPAPGIVELARRVGGVAWMELELFSLTGGWASATGHDEAAAQLGGQSVRHGRHAEAWLARLPELAEVPPGEQVRAPDAAAAEAVELLRGTQDGADRLAALARVCRALADGLDEHLATIDERLDGPTVRLLRGCSADLRADAIRCDAVAARLAASSLE